MPINKYKNHLTLVLNANVLERYTNYYFLAHPRAYKQPISHPRHESINVWFVMKRPQMNALKQKWKDFIKWWIHDLGYDDMHLDKFEMLFITYMPTKRRYDPDNSVPKFILDGFTESGFITDDDGEHLQFLTLATKYDKENPRTTIDVWY